MGALDHYTLIVPDARATLKFYTEVCGFDFIGEMLLNSGTVTSNEHDMLNYILRLPGKEEQICVITEGLNERTLFSQYLKKCGAGIHHIAYRVDNIEKMFETLKGKNITLTSEDVIHDQIFGLKQFFIDRVYSGVFIEFIERTGKVDDYMFTQQNMKELASSIKDFI